MRDFIMYVSHFALGYHVLYSLTLLVLVALGGRLAKHHIDRTPAQRSEDIFASPLTPGISVVIPARNEEDTIIACVRSALGSRYPRLEVIVVDDGSTDSTLDQLRREYDLEDADMVVPDLLSVIGPIRAISRSRRDRRLMVIKKESIGTVSDALNAAIQMARMPLVCTLDADSVLEPGALLSIANHYLVDPDHVIAVGGAIYPLPGLAGHQLGDEEAVADGAEGGDGRSTISFPDSILVCMQVIEYLRAFLLSRATWSRMNGLMIISGAFGLFRRDVLIDVGGFPSYTVGQDSQLVVRLHRYMRDQDRPYRMAYAVDAGCWTTPPTTIRALGRQRMRWAKGLWQTVTANRGMMRPKYGFFGLGILPYYIAFEFLAGFVELLGLVTVVIGLIIGVVDLWLALTFLFMAAGMGLCATLMALVVNRVSLDAYARGISLTMLVAVIAEMTIYRPVHAFWRVVGPFRRMSRDLFAGQHPSEEAIPLRW